MPKKNQAIQYLLDHTPPETLQQVYHLTTDPDGSGWPGQHHLGLGLAVRNSLRGGGFTWDDQTLDSQWAGLITEAARRYVEAER